MKGLPVSAALAQAARKKHAEMKQRSLLSNAQESI